MGFVRAGIGFFIFGIAVGLFYRSIGTVVLAALLEVMCLLLWYSDRRTSWSTRHNGHDSR
jgi:hypothetical protein